MGLNRKRRFFTRRYLLREEAQHPACTRGPTESGGMPGLALVRWKTPRLSTHRSFFDLRRGKSHCRRNGQEFWPIVRGSAAGPGWGPLAQPPAPHPSAAADDLSFREVGIPPPSEVQSNWADARPGFGRGFAARDGAASVSSALCMALRSTGTIRTPYGVPGDKRNGRVSQCGKLFSGPGR